MNYIFGINIHKYVRDHETYIKGLLAEKNVTNSDIDYHNRRLAYLQHERLIHLIVTFATLFVALLLSAILYLQGSAFEVIYTIIDVIIYILFLFYIAHYFFLENHCQYWYILCDELNNYKED